MARIVGGGGARGTAGTAAGAAAGLAGAAAGAAGAVGGAAGVTAGAAAALLARGSRAAAVWRGSDRVSGRGSGLDSVRGPDFGSDRGSVLGSGRASGFEPDLGSDLGADRGSDRGSDLASGRARDLGSALTAGVTWAGRILGCGDTDRAVSGRKMLDLMCPNWRHHYRAHAAGLDGTPQ